MITITNRHALRKDSLSKFIRIMRLTLACLLMACLHVSAAGYAQSNITLHLKSVELRKALIAIEDRSAMS